MENSFVLLGQFRKQAKRAGWNEVKIKQVLDNATNGDREHLEEVLFEALSELEND